MIYGLLEFFNVVSGIVSTAHVGQDIMRKLLGTAQSWDDSSYAQQLIKLANDRLYAENETRKQLLEATTTTTRIMHAFLQGIDEQNQCQAKQEQAESIIARAILACKNRNFLEAIALYSDAIEIIDNSAVRFVRGSLYNLLGYYSKAVQDFDVRLQNESHDVEAYNARGIAYLFLDNSIKAQQDFESSLKLRPDGQEETEGHIAYCNGEWIKAIKFYRQVLKEQENTLNAEEGASKGRSKQSDQPIDTIHTLLLIGLSLMNLGETRNAIAFFQRILETPAVNSRIRTLKQQVLFTKILIAEAYSILGENEEYVRVLDEVSALDSGKLTQLTKALQEKNSEEITSIASVFLTSDFLESLKPAKTSNSRFSVLLQVIDQDVEREFSAKIQKLHADSYEENVPLALTLLKKALKLSNDRSLPAIILLSSHADTQGNVEQADMCLKLGADLGNPFFELLYGLSHFGPSSLCFDQEDMDDINIAMSFIQKAAAHGVGLAHYFLGIAYNYKDILEYKIPDENDSIDVVEDIMQDDAPIQLNDIVNSILAKDTEKFKQLTSDMELLELANKRLADDDIVFLAGILRHNNTIKYLNLSGNNIGFIGMRALEELLHENQILENIKIENMSNAPTGHADIVLYHLMASALFGTGFAYLALGAAYREGLFGVQANIQESIKYFKRASALDISLAHFHLWNIYCYGVDNVESDYSAAIKYLKKSADGGYGLAQYILATGYHYGKWDITQNKETALQYYKNASSAELPIDWYGLKVEIADQIVKVEELNEIIELGDDGSHEKTELYSTEDFTLFSPNILIANYTLEPHYLLCTAGLYKEGIPNVFEINEEMSNLALYRSGKYGHVFAQKLMLVDHKDKLAEDNLDNKLKDILTIGLDMEVSSLQMHYLGNWCDFEEAEITQEIISMLERLGARNIGAAQGWLGSLLLYEKFTNRDLSRGVALLESSAEKGSSFAKFLLGVSYMKGLNGLPFNLDKAISFLESVVNDVEDEDMMAIDASAKELIASAHCFLGIIYGRSHRRLSTTIEYIKCCVGESSYKKYLNYDKAIDHFNKASCLGNKQAKDALRELQGKDIISLGCYLYDKATGSDSYDTTNRSSLSCTIS